ncbi:DUF554 domain-containing protein [Candidatus Enterococcus ferrettii]|uniref:DUF554 domain-containing protein n=1 Tax=Candidatus Enterococcus ferrettii TaxID=2815324 RepID=A0ABV0EUK1_9ENTE|nr:DUF554 domain-containing protein [Enterococcus sp. 665A]MBO1340361.1 DUF554 domain-containing protein [Enterococcus sp. 665A]
MFIGSIVNALSVMLGSILGAFLRNITEQTKETMTHGLSLAVIAISIQMAIQTASFILVIICICLGGMLGEFFKIEDRMNQFGLLLQKRFANGNGNFAEGFVTASLVYVVGSMGIIGAIESGITGSNHTLFMKAIMDGFISIVLTASLGIGVFFSAFAVLIYQGALTLLAYLIAEGLPNQLLDPLMNEISAVGGIIILGIGLNMLKLTTIRTSNFLPSMIVLILIMSIKYYFF